MKSLLLAALACSVSLAVACGGQAGAPGGDPTPSPGSNSNDTLQAHVEALQAQVTRNPDGSLNVPPGSFDVETHGQSVKELLGSDVSSPSDPRSPELRYLCGGGYGALPLVCCEAGVQCCINWGSQIAKCWPYGG